MLQTRAEPLGIELVLAEPAVMDFGEDSFGLLLQLPSASGACPDPTEVIARAQAADVLVIAAVDPLAQVLMQFEQEATAAGATSARATAASAAFTSVQL